MKKLVFVFVVLMTNIVASKAQYYFPLGAGSGLGWGTAAGSAEWCMQQQQLINQQRMVNAYWNQQLLNQARLNADMARYWLLNHPCEPNPMPRPGIRQKSECSYCGGQGWITKRMWHGGDKVTTNRERCGFCHGKGVR